MNRIVRVTLSVLVLACIVTAVVFALRSDRASNLSSRGAAGQWTCSMHPPVRQSGPGKCPICGMDLIPVERLEGSQNQRDARSQLLTEPVAYRALVKEVRTVGKLDYNERHVAYITARVAGRIDRVYADFTGIVVRPNDHLVDIYSPELVVAQGELVRAAEARRSRPGDNSSYADTALEAARAKLRLWGLTSEQIQDIERSGKTTTLLTVHAPMGGTVVEKNVRAGQYVKEGDALYRIADLDPIWLYLDIYESDLAWVRFGQQVSVTVEAFPGELFQGTVVFVDPFLNDQTRTVKARVNLKNPDRRLKPAMYAAATIQARVTDEGNAEPTGLEGKYVCPMHPEILRDAPGTCPICQMPLELVPKPTAAHEHSGHATTPNPQRGVLSVPVSAVLDTGRRKIVYRQLANGTYELVDVRLGPWASASGDRNQSNRFYVVLGGLKEGDRVVARGGFLLDSQRQIEGLPSLLYPEGQSAANLHSGHGGPPASPNNPQHKH